MNNFRFRKVKRVSAGIDEDGEYYYVEQVHPMSELHRAVRMTETPHLHEVFKCIEACFQEIRKEIRKSERRSRTIKKLNKKVS